jgi:hypothetical protein
MRRKKKAESTEMAAEVAGAAQLEALERKRQQALEEVAEEAVVADHRDTYFRKAPLVNMTAFIYKY